MAQELPKRLEQSLRRPFYLLDAESERPVADTLFRPDGGPIAAEIKRRWNAFEALEKALQDIAKKHTWDEDDEETRAFCDYVGAYQAVIALARAALALAGAAATGE